jgi:hypothetical protein
VIPTVLVAGLVLALLLPSWWWVLALSVTWALLIGLSVSGDPTTIVAALLLGAINGLIGVVVGWGLRSLIDRGRNGIGRRT